jgi:hypothetical protein
VQVPLQQPPPLQAWPKPMQQPPPMQVARAPHDGDEQSVAVLQPHAPPTQRGPVPQVAVQSVHAPLVPQPKSSPPL